MKTLLKSISLLLCVITVLLSLPATSSAAAAEDKAPFDVDALSALLMDSATGEVLYAKNAAEALPPASVTKIMTLLLVMEAIDALIAEKKDWKTAVFKKVQSIAPLLLVRRTGISLNASIPVIQVFPFQVMVTFFVIHSGFK